MLSNPFLFWLCRLLPAPVASWLGGWLSLRLARPRMKLRDGRARANLALLRPDLSVEKREAILTRRWINVGRTLAELANRAVANPPHHAEEVEALDAAARALGVDVSDPERGDRQP